MHLLKKALGGPKNACKQLKVVAKSKDRLAFVAEGMDVEEEMKQRAKKSYRVTIVS